MSQSVAAPHLLPTALVGKHRMIISHTFLQAEERGGEVGESGGVVDHWNQMVDSSPECLSQLQSRIGDQPAAFVGNQDYH